MNFSKHFLPCGCAFLCDIFQELKRIGGQNVHGMAMLPESKVNLFTASLAADLIAESNHASEGK